MGLTYANVTLRKSLRRGPAYSAQFLVDTGSLLSLAPADELRKIGVRPEGTQRVELADGSKTEFEYGEARFEVAGQSATARVFFAEPGTEPLLGAFVMEALALVVHPPSQTLKRLDTIPLK